MSVSKAQERKIVAAYTKGVPTKMLADEFSISDTAIRDVLRRNGVTPSRAKVPLSAAQKAAAFRLFKSGWTMRQIATHLGTSHGFLSKILRRDFGVQKRSSTRPKSLSLEQRAEIARRYTKYATYAELCKEFDCAPSVVQAALDEHGIQPRSGWAKYRTVDWQDRKGRTVRFKSSWEQAFAQLLDRAGADWDYEPEHFALQTCRRYTPDFRVQTARGPLYVEVKGWLDDRTERRLAEFRKQYPNKPFYLVGPADLAGRGLVPVAFAKHPQAGRVARATVRLGLNAPDLFTLLEAV